jgi:multiple sugar transport system substrate-binding protein
MTPDSPGGLARLSTGTDRVDPAIVEQFSGHNYYIPIGADVTLMIYNKQLFEEAASTRRIHLQTWDEYLAAAEAIDNLGNDIYGNVFWNEALAWGGWYWNMLQPIYLNGNQGQCQLVNRLGTDITFDDPDCQMEAFFEFTQAAQQFAPLTMETNFFSRKIGMWPQYGYSWEPNLETAADQPMVIGEDVGVAPVPVPNEGDPSFTTYGGRALIIMKTTPERQARAWVSSSFSWRGKQPAVHHRARLPADAHQSAGRSLLPGTSTPGVYRSAAERHVAAAVLHSRDRSQ